MTSVSTSAASVPTGVPAASLSAHTLPRGVVLSLALVYSIWSSTFLALRYMVADLPPLASSGARFLVAGVIMFAWLRMRGAAAPTLRQWGLCAATGSAMFFMGNGFVAIAAREVPSGVTAMAIGSVPLFLAALEALLGQRPSLRQCAGLALGFGGVACMCAASVTGSGSALWLLVLAPIGWAVASLLTRSCSLPTGAMAGAAQLICGGASLLLGGFAMGERVTTLPESSSLYAFAYLVVFGSIIGYSAALYLLRNASAAVATSYAYVNPVLALALGATLGGEKLGASAVLSGLLVVSGVVLLLTEPRPRAADAA
jgi:drug/metabolite transporter (DMT)-like permease